MGSIKDRWVISGFVKNDTWIIEHYRMSPEVKRLKIYLDNFFEGGQELSKHSFKYNTGFLIIFVFLYRTFN